MASTTSCQGMAKIVFLFAMLPGLASVRIRHGAQRTALSSINEHDNEVVAEPPPESTTTLTTTTSSETEETEALDCFTEVDPELTPMPDFTDCQKAIHFGKFDGIINHPEWYIGSRLSKTSSWYDWQMFVASLPDSQGCLKPCPSSSTTQESTTTYDHDEGVANVMKNMEPILDMMDRLEKRKKHWGKEGHSLDASIHFENRPWDPPASQPSAQKKPDDVEKTEEVSEHDDQIFVELMMEGYKSNNFSRVFNKFDKDHDGELNIDECLNFTKSVYSNFRVNTEHAHESMEELCVSTVQSHLDVDVFEEKARGLASSFEPIPKHDPIADSGEEPSFISELMKNVRITADLKYHSWGDYNTENRPWHNGDSTTTTTIGDSITTSAATISTNVTNTTTQPTDNTTTGDW